MQLVANILPYAQIILSVVLVTAILLQQSGAGLGARWGVMEMLFIILAEVLKNFSLFIYCLWNSFCFVSFSGYNLESKKLAKTILH